VFVWTGTFFFWKDPAASRRFVPEQTNKAIPKSLDKHFIGIFFKSFFTEARQRVTAGDSMKNQAAIRGRQEPP